MSKQKIPTGAKLKFLGYAEEGAEGPLADMVGSSLTVTGYDKEEDTYNVLTEDGETADSLFEDEFEVVEVEKPAIKKSSKKAAAKKTAAKKTAKAKAEEVVKEATKKAATKKAAKKTAPKKAKEEVEMVPFKKTTTLTATLKEYGGDAVAAAYGWAEEVEKSNFVLGGLLAFIKRNDEHTKVTEENEEGTPISVYGKGLKGFNDFVEEYLNIKSVKAHWLVRIYETFSQVATEKQLSEVGWTKLRELLPLGDLLTEDNVGEWLEDAKSKTTAELHESVKESLVDGGGSTHGNKNKDKMKSMKFIFFNHQADVVTEAIEQMKGEMEEEAKGKYPDSAALYAIISDWMDMHRPE